ncbi:hypothetical protein ACPCA8_20220 [Streptomyces capoamus]|uniref:hypothetical protein n=1 Tax=Streptomyces capoamus TaxID=68183 RepID=UPI003C2BA7F1
MTQSGQGEEPSARPAREGIVLPSDGGEPLLPGMTATPAGPAGGQAWDGSWGPGQQTPRQDEGQHQGHHQGQHQAQQQAQDQGWAQAPQWGGQAQPPPAAAPGPLPPEGAPAPAYGGQAPAYGGQDGPYGGYGAAQQPGFGAPDPYQQQPPHQQPYPGAQPAPGAPLPPAHPGAGAPLPPAADGATQYLPPVPAGPGEAATQYIPPVQAAPADGATQFLPPVPAGAGEAATQYIPPVAAGALPPESGGEETRYLGRTPRQTAPTPSDAEATQYIPPYAAPTQTQPQVPAQGADRQPPAEFDNLFRGGPGGDGPAGSTQQLPRVQQPDAYPGPAQAPYRPAQPSYDAGPDDDGGGRRGGRSRVPLFAAVGVGIVVLGVGAGALLSGGSDKHKGGADQTVAASSPAATEPSGSPAADPARQQAVALDRLLADSGSSRSSVIQAVADVKRCDNLDQAAGNLRDAAGQRGELVTRLGKLSVDKLPGNAGLTDALTKAWQASAAADNHYAAWADQAKNRRVCHKGHARTTGETQAGNRESGTASAQKAKAAALWNTIAQKYGLTQRQPTQL